MKLKSFLIAIVSTFVLLSSASSYALDVYLTNGSFTNIIFFKFPNGITYGPVPAHQQVKLPVDESKNLTHQVGEVFFGTRKGMRSCGYVDFSKASVVAFRVTMLDKCTAVAVGM